MSHEKLASLERLQDIDLEIEALTQEADLVPARLAELEAAAAQARQSADAQRGRLADNERARFHQENVLAEDKEKVKKWEQRLPQLKTPREFAALQREVENAKKANLAAEEELGRLRGEAEGIKATLREKEAEQAAREAALTRTMKDLSGGERELREKIETLAKRRAGAKAEVDVKLVASYETIRRRRPGKALVAVLNGSCSACHRKLSPQAANRLLVAGTLDTCPSCQRLVFTPRSAD